jgi:hypothetical protein
MRRPPTAADAEEGRQHDEHHSGTSASMYVSSVGHVGTDPDLGRKVDR